VIERASCSVKLLKTQDHDAVLRLRRVRTVARDGKRQLCVARSEWNGHVTMPKGGRLRYVLLTRRLPKRSELNGISAGRAWFVTRKGSR